MRDTTIYQIAAEAKVSASTVSRVINNYPYVKKATRTKVLKLLQKYSYIPNDTARSLTNRETKMVAILISDLRTTHHTEGIYYIQNELSKKGYSCLIYNTGLDVQNQVNVIRTIGQKKVDGVVFMGSIYQNDTVKDAIQTYISDVPVMMCYGYLDCPNVYGLISDGDIGISNCIKLLCSKGKMHPALVIDFDYPGNILKIEGYKRGLTMYCPGAEEVIIKMNQRAGVEKFTSDLIKKHPEVDGIIYSEDEYAIRGLKALDSLGINVPDKISVIGVNNSKYAEIGIKSLTSLDNMLYDVSIAAVRNLLAILQGESVNRKMIICTQISERETT